MIRLKESNDVQFSTHPEKIDRRLSRRVKFPTLCAKRLKSVVV